MRSTIAILGALVFASILLDPYSWHLNASDAVVPAPAWQLTLSLIDAGVLVVGVGLALRDRAEVGFTVLAVEYLFNLGLCALLVHRDGVARFLHGFGGEEYLSLYLAALALRVLLLAAVKRSGVSRDHAAA